MTKQKIKIEEVKKNNGITLIALVITIIVLLILAGVSIATLTGNNGILTRANQAKENTIVGTEGEQVKIAYSSAMINRSGDNVSALELKEELDNVVGKDKTKVSGATRIKVHFLDTGNEYVINNGVVSEYQRPEATSVYAKVFDTNGDSKGDLFVLSSTNDYDTEEYGTLIADYDNKDNSEEQPMGGDDYWDPIWYDNQTSNVETVIIRDKIVPKSCGHWFSEGFTLLKEIRNIENLDTSNVESMDSMFLGCLNLEELDLSSWDTSNVTNMKAVFDMNNENKLKNINLAGWDTSNVTTMRNMFYGCNKLTSIDVRGLDTSNVTDMAYMFYRCSQLTSLDVTGFDTSNVTNMSSMFDNCSQLTSIDVTGFDTSNVTNMYKMFYGCSQLTSLDVTNFSMSKISNVMNISRMFEGVTCKIELGQGWTDEMKESSGYEER